MKKEEKPKMFSLEWFKSKLKPKKEIIKVSEYLETLQSPFKYKNIKLVNDNLTVVLEDGKVMSKLYSDIVEYEKIINCKTIQQFNKIFYTEPEKDLVENADKLSPEETNNGFELLKQLNDFIVKDNVVTFKETNRTVPTLLVNKFIEIINELKVNIGFENIQTFLNINTKYQAHKNFFLWCCLNPRAEIADNLYTFLENNSFNITKQGFIVALRNVVTVSENTELVNTISSVYHKVRTIWRKHTYKYFMFQNKETKEYSISLKKDCSDKLTLIGNLKELYDNLPEMDENRYTDAHTSTFDIRIGKVVSMPKEDCNWNTLNCSGHAGLHFTSKEINYVGCGDQSIIMLINPMKIVGIGEKKGRCYEYLPIMAVSTEESTTILQNLDFDTLEIEENYAISELENLKEHVKQGFVAEANKHEFNLPTITTTEISNIINSLNDMKKEIKSRVVKLKK